MGETRRASTKLETKDLTSAFVVGPATVDGAPREHVAFKIRPHVLSCRPIESTVTKHTALALFILGHAGGGLRVNLAVARVSP